MKRGFTMIEICITMAIMTIVLGPLFLMYDKMQQDTRHLTAMVTSHQAARQLLLRITHDLTTARAVDVDPNLDGFHADGVRWHFAHGRMYHQDRTFGSLVVRDFVVYRRGSVVVATLQGEVDAVSPPFTMSTRVRRERAP